MVTDTKISLLLLGLHPAVCYSTAPLSNTISAAWLFRGEGRVLRREEKRREEKRREEKEASSRLKFLKQDFSENCSLHNLPCRTFPVTIKSLFSQFLLKNSIP
jgi:hypothetical protein